MSYDDSAMWLMGALGIGSVMFLAGAVIILNALQAASREMIIMGLAMLIIGILVGTFSATKLLGYDMGSALRTSLLAIGIVIFIIGIVMFIVWLHGWLEQILQPLPPGVVDFLELFIIVVIVVALTNSLTNKKYRDTIIY